MINKDFTLHPEALELKELGFDEPCFGRYNNNDDHLLIAHTEKYIISNGVDRSEFFILAPLYQQAFRWFREKHGLNSFVYHYGKDGILDTIYFAYNINDNLYASDFKTYEEAELACLRKLIEIVKASRG